MSVYRGSCVCGAVRYHVEGRVSAIWLCHCSKCRRATGSAFAATALCRAERFHWDAGEGNVASWTSPTGYECRFCRTCGAPLPWEDEGRVFLNAGALEGPFERGVVRHIFAASKAPWWEITDDRPRFDEHAPED